MHFLKNLKLKTPLMIDIIVIKQVTYWKKVLNNKNME